MGTAVSRAMRAYRHGRLAAARLRGLGNRWHGVRILGYHRLAPAVESLSVAPDAFRRQMEHVAASDVRPIRLDEAIALLERGPVDGRYVCVTFDDGYLDNVEVGEPILRELGIPATIFLPTGIVDGRATYFWYDDPPPALGWDEVRDVARGGVIDFQSHTVTHAWLPQLSRERALEELSASKAELEGHVDYPVTSVAFPGGLHGAREIELARQVGYRAALSTDSGVNATTESLRALRRTNVVGGLGDDVFAAQMAGLFDRPSLPHRLFHRLASPARRHAPPGLG